tara:strand:+ start:2237 stop:3097 length:861 start_codon:yes stop_codon:yes gene_type:complete
MFKIINYFFQTIIIYILFLFGRILGIKLSRKFFAYLFKFLGSLFKSRKIIKKNIRTYSRNISNLEEKEIIEGMWNNYGMTFIEYIFLDYFRKNSSHIFIEGEEILSNLLERNSPVIFVSGHFANFELMSMEITKKGIPLATIYRPLNNLFLNPLMEYLRRKFVCKNQIKKGINGVREAIDYIKKRYSIALMIDQRVSEGEKINFFGEPAFTTTLPAQLAIKYNLSIIPVYIERIDDQKFKIKFEKEILPKNFENKFKITEELNKILENMVIKNPKQWIWTHNRWKK